MLVIKWSVYYSTEPIPLMEHISLPIFHSPILRGAEDTLRGIIEVLAIVSEKEKVMWLTLTYLCCRAQAVIQKVNNGKERVASERNESRATAVGHIVTT